MPAAALGGVAAVRFLLDLVVKAVFAAESRDMSLLHALFYFNSGTGVLYLTSTAGGAQDSRLVGGSQLVSLKLAARLGARVVLGAPVRRIVQGSGGVTVQSDAGSWHARRVIWRSRRRWPGGSTTSPRCHRCATASPSASRRAR